MKLGNYAVVKEDDIVNAYTRHGSRYVGECVHYLEGKGLLPLYVDNRFPLVNVLASFAFYSGCVLNTNVNISEDPSTLVLIQNNIAEKLDIRTKTVPRKGTGGPILTMAEGGACMARLMEAMGLPRRNGSKTCMKVLEVPHYRKELLRMARCGEMLDADDKERIRRLQRDSTAVLFSTKTQYQSPKYWCLYLPARPTEEEALSTAMENFDFINFSAPDLEFSRDDVKITRLKSGNYLPRVPINGRRLDRILDRNKDLIKFNRDLQQLCGLEPAFEAAEI